MDGWFVRLLAGAVLTLAGAAAGRVLSDAKKKRAYQLKDVCQAVGRLPIAMLDKRMPLEMALASVGNDCFKAVSGLIKTEKSAHAAWRRAKETLRSKSGQLSMLNDTDIETLDALFAAIGLTGAAEQRLLLSDAYDTLDGFYVAAKKKADEQAKLYSTLGLLTGLALAILLI